MHTYTKRRAIVLCKLICYLYYQKEKGCKQKLTYNKNNITYNKIFKTILSTIT